MARIATQAAVARDWEAEEWSGCPPASEVLKRCRQVLNGERDREWSIAALACRLEIAPRLLGQVLAAAGVDLPQEG